MQTARAATVATHAWTKLYSKIMSWISGVYECRSCMALTLRPKFVLPVSWWLVALQTRSKLPRMLQPCFELSTLTLWQLPFICRMHGNCPSSAECMAIALHLPNAWQLPITCRMHGIDLCKLKCAHLRFTVYSRKQANIHMHVCNAVLLVWSLLRLAPITRRLTCP